MLYLPSKHYFIKLKGILRERTVNYIIFFNINKVLTNRRPNSRGLLSIASWYTDLIYSNILLISSSVGTLPFNACFRDESHGWTTFRTTLSEHPVFFITNTLSFLYPSGVRNDKVVRNVNFPITFNTHHYHKLFC
jgi:hypothetical protein